MTVEYYYMSNQERVLVLSLLTDVGVLVGVVVGVLVGVDVGVFRQDNDGN